MDIPLEIGKSWLTFGCLCRWSINDAKARVLSCASQPPSSLSSSSCAPPKSQWGEKSCLLFPLKHRCCALSIRLARTLQQRHTWKRWIDALQQVAWGVFFPATTKRQAKSTGIASVCFYCSDTLIIAFCMRFSMVWMVRQIRYSSCKNTAYREWCAVQLRKYSVGVTFCSTRLPQEVFLLGQRGKDSRCQQGAVCWLGKQDACLATVSSWVHSANIKMKLKKIIIKKNLSKSKRN